MMESIINGSRGSNTSLKADVSNFVREARQLFLQASDETADKAIELRNKGMALLDEALTKGSDMQSNAILATKKIVKSTDSMVHENPWKAVAISAGVGLIIGLLAARK